LLGLRIIHSVASGFLSDTRGLRLWYGWVRLHKEQSGHCEGTAGTPSHSLPVDVPPRLRIS